MDRTEAEPTWTHIDDVAELIGLADSSLLGTQPIELPAETLEKLRRYGDAAELDTTEAGRILRVSRKQVVNYCLDQRPAKRLGHRCRGRTFLISAHSLAAYIVLINKPPVPTCGERPIFSERRAKKALEACRKKFGLGPKKTD